MSEMIERVARALWAVSDDSGEPWPWNECPEAQKAGYRLHARAAVEATREPTEAMMLAACHAGNADMEASWRAAVDEALK